ncbi:Protein-N(pi)-phosphohistidine--sugarphosphotran sferase [Coriobacterium glomerans PW2]|uniref:Protein-N(Pi)-phosphohistidine--sugarphosphotran sferase n=1 Tax=Coriobacterium glomerans (strain ATCC 49209 / DSM 20642 / JCM 10262 / PW2) TaxID=700015 RepID=F2N917_CORGP|nr:PTS transporter subunit EIIC [Coriobacterium glomerans]AEB07693.1 Protein-N(pi)-phosphohistidine--sugarphosphotran sferase [Coriobacterium glomerans PW2]
MADNRQIATDVLAEVGGAANIISASNCMTRLRLTLKDDSKAVIDSIKKIKGVLGAQFSGSQLQVIIGQNVPKVCEEFCAAAGIAQAGDKEQSRDVPREKLTLKVFGNRVLDYISGSMVQLIPLVMAGGLFRTFAVVLGPQMLHVISDTDATYTFFYTTLYEATFYFLPIYLGYACAKKIGASPVLGMLTGGLLVAPSITQAAANSEHISVYGISITAANYSQTVVPIVLSVVVLYFVEKWMKRHVPDILSTIFAPFCTMIIVVPVALILVAPIGNELGNLLANSLFPLSKIGGVGIIVVMAVLGASWQLFVVAGMHMPVIMLAQVQIIQVGYDPFVFVSTNCAMTAVWGCALGSFLRLRNKEEKGLSLGYVVSAMLGGVTEPALFGILLRFRRTMLGMFIGGAVGAVISGILGVTYYMAGGASNLLVVLNYLQGGQRNVVCAVIGMAISFAVATVVVYMTGFSKQEMEQMDADSE